MEAQNQPTDLRQATAERNVQAILDGAERLLGRGQSASISAVASEAGVSRVTVYAHFPDRKAVLEAVVERSVEQVSAVLEAADLSSGSPLDALRRLVTVGWEQLGHHSAIRRASAAELSGEGMRRTHGSARNVVDDLVQRGRDDGSFRDDVPAAWLTTSLLALMHAGADQVRAGVLDANTALEALLVTVTDLFSGSGARLR